MIDLHTHSTASDGTVEPNKLPILAKNKGLDAIALTDHDTINGLEEFVSAGKECGIDVIPGIEFSTYWNNLEIHLLGYYIDFKYKWLNEQLVMLQQKRLERTQKIIVKLNELGYDINLDEVKALATETLGRPHIAKVLFTKGYVTSTKEAFNSLLGHNKPAYVPRFKLTPFQAVDLIKRAKGIPILAHPGLYKSDWEPLLKKLVEHGLQGLEAIYPLHSKDYTNKLIELATRHNILITGGSDYHGSEIKENRLGEPEVPNLILKKLQNNNISNKDEYNNSIIDT